LAQGGPDAKGLLASSANGNQEDDRGQPVFPGGARAIRGEPMARKPNYRFERSERDRQKAAKKAERLAAKKEKVDSRKDPETEAGTEASEPSEE